MSVGFESYGQKCPIAVAGRKIALSPNLDSVTGSDLNPYFFVQVAYWSFLSVSQRGQREDEISSPF